MVWVTPNRAAAELGFDGVDHDDQPDADQAAGHMSLK
jgi:hypothetical protein